MNDLERKEQNAQRELNNKRFNALVIFVVIGGIIALIWKLTGNATGKTASNSTNIVRATNANTPAKNLYAKGSNGWTPLHDAARSGQTETEIALIKDKARSGQGHKSNIIYLYRAIEDGQVEITTALIKVGTPVNAKDNNGWTPLHFAAYHSQTEIALALIKAGARLDMHTDNNKTPLDIAVEKHGKDSDIVRLLLKHEGKE